MLASCISKGVFACVTSVLCHYLNLREPPHPVSTMPSGVFGYLKGHFLFSDGCLYNIICVHLCDALQ